MFYTGIGDERKSIAGQALTLLVEDICIGPTSSVTGTSDDQVALDADTVTTIEKLVRSTCHSLLTTTIVHNLR